MGTASRRKRSVQPEENEVEETFGPVKRSVEPENEEEQIEEASPIVKRAGRFLL